MNGPAVPEGKGGIGRKCRKPFSPNTRKTRPSRIRAIKATIFITFFLSQHQDPKHSTITGFLRIWRSALCSPPCSHTELQLLCVGLIEFHALIGIHPWFAPVPICRLKPSALGPS